MMQSADTIVARVGWDERSESQQIQAVCWVSFLNPAY